MVKYERRVDILLTTWENPCGTVIRWLSANHRLRAALVIDAPGQPDPDRVGPGRHTRGMATVTSVEVERSGPAIRAALAEHAPDDEPRFTAELRSALARAGEDLDLAGPQAVLARWHALATMAANPLTADEQAQLARARAFNRFSVRDEHGTWTIL
jgi:Family of unknown function (DUF6247)